MAGLRRPLLISHFHRWDIPLLWLLSIGLLALGLTRPVLETEALIFFRDEHSIFHGIRAMWEEQHYALAILLLVFSIIFPVVKLAALALLWALPFSTSRRKALLFQIKVLGKWSMLDVFVVAVVVVITQAGGLLDARPREGLYFFAAAVLLSMILTFLVDQVARRG